MHAVDPIMRIATETADAVNKLHRMIRSRVANHMQKSTFTHEDTPRMAAFSAAASLRFRHQVTQLRSTVDKRSCERTIGSFLRGSFSSHIRGVKFLCGLLHRSASQFMTVFILNTSAFHGKMN